MIGQNEQSDRQEKKSRYERKGKRLVVHSVVGKQTRAVIRAGHEIKNGKNNQCIGM
jgi:hypothetical protein